MAFQIQIAASEATALEFVAACFSAQIGGIARCPERLAS